MHEIFVVDFVAPFGRMDSVYYNIKIHTYFIYILWLIFYKS